VTREGDRCPDNLLARSRRGPLSSVERRALDAHLSGCALCRSTVALAAIYDDAPDELQPGDEGVLSRLAGRVAAGQAHRRRARPSRAQSVAAALVLLVIAGGAAAWVASRPHTSAPPVPLPPPPRATISHVASAPPSPKAVTATEEEPRAPIALPRGHAVRRPMPARTAAAPEIARGPGELFAAANTARRTGDLRGAISQYLALYRRYPASPEGGVSRVSAGDLLLRLGEPAAALEQFDGYLAARGADPLGPEALFGRARCLRALGRNDEEGAAWEELSRRFPGSVYEASGRRRLEELGR